MITSAARRTVFDVAAKKETIIQLEERSKEEGFWDDPRRAARSEERRARLQDVVDRWTNLENEAQALLSDIDELLLLRANDEKEGDYTSEERDSFEAMERDSEQRLYDLQERYDAAEFETFLSGEHDADDAVLSISAGAGGMDAQDWASMLLRMYQRYCEQRGWSATIAHQSFGEEGGIKQVELQIEGPHAYGYLKGEQGVHRLVRLSPFSSQSLRHTSFALVEVVPLVHDMEEIVIDPSDLRVDTYRASGPGGQYVNKTESAVRITHLPTGMVAASQAERSQQRNRETAMTMLRSKLQQRLEEEQTEELSALKPKAKPEWGSQIRSYVLHPYRMVKDHRTDVEIGNADGVLEGNIEPFIEAEIRQLSHD